MWDEWKCVLMVDGELCLMMDGRILMVKLFVDSWAIVHQVSSYIILHYKCFRIINSLVQD